MFSKIKKGIRNPRLGFDYLKKQRDIQKDIEKGKKYFGNVAGYLNNEEGRKNILNAQSHSNIKKLTDDRIQKMQDLGVLSLGLPYDKELIKNIQEKYNKLIEDDKYSFVRTQFKGEVSSRQIKEASKSIPELAELLTEDIIHLIEGYYNSHFQPKYLICWRNYHVPDDVVQTTETFSDRWHCDVRTTDIFKLFVYLSDVTDDDGPFHILTIPRVKELIDLGFGNRHNYKLPTDDIEEDNNLIRATGNAGTALLCNTELCLHKAGIPKKGHVRDIIQFQFVPSKEPLAENWIEKVELKYNEMIPTKQNPSIT